MATNKDISMNEHFEKQTNSPSLRPMRLEDVPAVYAIEIIAQVVPWSEGIFRDCLQAGYSGWVVERGQGQGIEGYILYYVRVGECHILNVCVKPTVQNTGHGTLLMRQALERAKEQGADVVFLEVRPSNHPAIHIYRKLGFNEVGIRKDYYSSPDGGREDALVFALQL